MKEAHIQREIQRRVVPFAKPAGGMAGAGQGQGVGVRSNRSSSRSRERQPDPQFSMPDPDHPKNQNTGYVPVPLPVLDNSAKKDNHLRPRGFGSSAVRDVVNMQPRPASPFTPEALGGGGGGGGGRPSD